MGKINAFFDHIHTAVKYGEWYCGFKQYEGKPQACISLVPYDGWHFCVHLLRFHLCVSYPWCGNL